MLLLEQNTTKKEKVDKMSQQELNEGHSKVYKVEVIKYNKFYTKKSVSSYLANIYDLILWKSHSEKKNTWGPVLTMLHFCKTIGTFYYNYLKKPITTFLSIDSTLPTVRLIVKPTIKPKGKALIKQKYNQPAKTNGIKKCIKKPELLNFILFLALF